jgi:hypothetical protein
MKLFGLLPERTRLGLQNGNRPNRHSQKVFRLACFFLTGAATESELPFRNGIVRLAIASSDASSRAYKLFEQSPGNGRLRNCVRKIDYCFSKPRCPLFEIISELRSGHSIFPNYMTLATLIPKRVLYFVIHHSHSNVRHSSFQVSITCSCPMAAASNLS